MKMGILICLILSICLCGCGTTAENKEADFENSFWGDSKKQVMKAESGKPEKIENSQKLLYLRNQFGLDCKLVYNFNDENKLFMVWVSFHHDESEEKLIQEFQSVNAQLIEKYGQPNSSKEEEEVYVSKWSNDRTEITHMLHLKNDPQHIIIYGSMEYVDDWKAE